MQRIGLSWFSQLGVSLKPLADVGRAETFDFQQVIDLHTAKGFLDTLADTTITHLQLRASQKLIQQLLVSINAVLDAQGDDQAQQFLAKKFWISYQWDQLNPVLHGELAVQNAYLVWPKRAYDTHTLADDAVKLFSDKTQAALTNLERYDIREAGKCLAFEVPTAALFHMFRATDSILRRWYQQIVGSEPTVKMRNWGVYIRVLREAGASEKILSAVEQVKDLHRNPIIHPEAMPTIDEALSFVGICESIISNIIADLTDRADRSVADLIAAASGAPAPIAGLGAPLLANEGDG